MTNTIPAIPTKFDGTQFRSRLEARWAAFFKILDFEYVYEPFDANGYIPDFTVKPRRLPQHPPLLVEVKPVSTDEEYKKAALNAGGKLDGQWKHGVIILGVNPYYQNKINHTAGFYWHVESIIAKAAAAAWWIRSTDDHDAPCYIKPAWREGGHVSGQHVYISQIDKWWRQAGNEVQWKSPAANQSHRDPEEVALELLQSELGATRVMSTAEQTQARIRRAQEKRQWRTL